MDPDDFDDWIGGEWADGLPPGVTLFPVSTSSEASFIISTRRAQSSFAATREARERRNLEEAWPQCYWDSYENYNVEEANVLLV